MDIDRIRNFSIIAHIDHGKSTLADRILELTGTIPESKLKEQILDSMDLERERGITIKAQAVRINYRSSAGEELLFNLIDTPGHVDFSYEVSRSLAACEGALLVVDGSQGVEAQTVANFHLALEAGLEVIPVLNKIDLPGAETERVKNEIKELSGCEDSDIVPVSAKTGQGVEALLEQIALRIPPPKGDRAKPLKALIFDSIYDIYRGVIVFVRVVDGSVEANLKVKMMVTGRHAEVEELGYFAPEMKPSKSLSAGEVGYLIMGVKDVSQIKVGDTVTPEKGLSVEPLAGYREVKPMVYCGLYPLEGVDYTELRTSLEKLRLNDASLIFEPESSSALGFGFRCGFLGLLHMEIVLERLEREYGMSLLSTCPNVELRVTKKNGDRVWVRTPIEYPAPHETLKVEEPYVRTTVLLPSDYIGAVMDLCQERRGIFVNMQYLSGERLEIIYDIPLSELILDFFDQLKSRTKGYASMDYEFIGYKETDLVRLDVLLQGKPVDALSFIIHKNKAYQRGKLLVEKLREIIPRQFYEVPIQAAIGGKVIARETVRAKRKDVLAKCYGGDITRKRKLLERQREGKKRMKRIGQVDLPQEAFLAVLRVGSE